MPMRAGDCVLPLSEEACSHLIALHGPMVKAACHRILHDAALAEDAAQEVFLLLVRKLPSLSPQTILGGWLYVTACHLARTHQRAGARRWKRETQAMEQLMKPAQDTLWLELEPLLDDAMLTLSQRQRELVLFRYFQNNSQRAAANLVGCSESVASRELAAAIERLRRFFTRHGVTVSGAALVTLLTTHGVQASLGAATVAATLSAASALAVESAASLPFFLALMKTTTATKIVLGAAALILTSGTVHYLTRTDVQTTQPKPADQASPPVAPPGRPPAPPEAARTPLTASPRAARPATSASEAKGSASYDEAALKAAREKLMKFQQRIGQLALMTDPLKVQEILQNEYGIRLSVDEIRQLQERGQKGFSFGVIESWATKQPQEALAWAASVAAEPNSGGADFHQLFLDAARRALPDSNRDALATMLPEGPGKTKLLDLAEASSDPVSLANRILTVGDPEERASRLRMLAQGWSDTERSVEWARQNLSGTDKTAFYAQVGYNLAHQNPESALQVLAELKGTDAYASTFGSMMRGLVQIGGQGQQAAELIANSDLNGTQRADLISELARRWVRNNPDATIAWANNLTAPEDFSAAIPLLVSQLDNERVSRTVETYLKSADAVMELALIEAAAPPGLGFDPEKSRLILDPLISRDSGIKITSNEGGGSSREALLWSSVNQTAKRQAEIGPPAAALEWLATLPFASQSDYSQAIGNVLNVWNVKSPTEAAAWLQNSALNPTLKADLQKAAQPAQP